MPRKTTRYTNYQFLSKSFRESDLKKLDEISASHKLEENIYPDGAGELLPFEEHLRLIAERYREFVATQFASFKKNKGFLDKIRRRCSRLVEGLNELPPEAGRQMGLTRMRSLAKSDRSEKLYKTIGTIESEIQNLKDEIDETKRFLKTRDSSAQIKGVWRCYVAAYVYEVFETFGLQPKLHDDSEYYLCIRIVLSHAGGRPAKESIKGFFSNCREKTGDEKFHILKTRVPSPK